MRTAPALRSFPPSPVSIARFSSPLHSSTINTTTIYSANSCQIQVCRRWARVNHLTLRALPGLFAHNFHDSILSSVILVAFRKLLLAARVPGVETITSIQCNTSRQVSTDHTITLASSRTTCPDSSFIHSHQQSTFTTQSSTIQRAALTHHFERAKAWRGQQSALRLLCQSTRVDATQIESSYQRATVPGRPAVHHITSHHLHHLAAVTDDATLSSLIFKCLHPLRGCGSYQVRSHPDLREHTAQCDCCFQKSFGDFVITMDRRCLGQLRNLYLASNTDMFCCSSRR